MTINAIYTWSIALLIVVALAYAWVHYRNRGQENRVAGLFSFIGEIISANHADGSELPAHQEPSPLLYQLRLPVSVLLGGGLLLAAMGLAIVRLVPDGERGSVYAFGLIGALFFIIGGQTAMTQKKPPQFAVRPLRWLSRWLEIAPGQLLLLLLAPCFVAMASLAAGDGPTARHLVVSALAWIVGIGCAIAGSLQRHESGSLRIHRRELLFLGVLFIAALILRGAATATIPSTFSGDEGSVGLSAIHFKNGDANNLFSIGWFSFPSFYYIVQSIGLRIWGQTIEALRIPSAIAGALAVIATYFLAKALFDRLTAGFATVYLAASHYHINMSRIGLNNIWDSLFGTIAVAGLWHGWKTGRRSGFIICGLALGLGQYFYVSIRALPVMFLIWALFAFLRDRATFKKRLPGLILTGFIAMIVFTPLGLYYGRHPQEFNAPLQRVTVLDGWLENEVNNTGKPPGRILAEQALKAAAGFVQEPLRLLYDPGAPLLLTGAATLFLLGLLWAIIHFDLRYLLLIMPMLGAIASNTVSFDPPASQRFVMAVPMVAILLSVPLGQATAWLQQLWSKHRQVVWVVTAVVMLWVVAADLKYYFFDIRDSYVLGDMNTLVATRMAYYLRDHEQPEQAVYFFGFPRMGYTSLSTIPYLAPDMKGQDVVDPLQQVPDWSLNGPTLFMFLPERASELEYVQAAYPGGDTFEFYSDKDEQLFAVYQVQP